MTTAPEPAAGGGGGGTVLVVDDDAAVRATIARFLARLGYDVASAASVEDALALMADGTAYDLVITDLQMPRSSGLDLLAEVRSRSPGTRTMLMSGRADVADAAAAVRHGIDRLLLKPFEFDELKAAVEESFTARRSQADLTREHDRLVSEVDRREQQSQLWILRAAHALAAAVEAKDAYTAGHAARVTAYAVAIADVVGGIDTAQLRLGAGLHDVGKIGVPDAVLNKTGRLSDDELALVRRHPAAGERILAPLIDDAAVLGIVRSHHERWDGRGYPDALRGDDIPLLARVLAAADALDAMTSNRAYRARLSWAAATTQVRRCAGSQFDPRVVAAFDAALPALAALYASFHADADPAATAGAAG